MSNSKVMNPSDAWGKQDDDLDLHSTLHKRKDHLDEAEEKEHSDVGKSHQGIFESLKNFTNMSRLLRITGAMAVIASMSAFLMQDWSGGSDLSRYYLMLTQTLLLAAGGFG